MVMASWPSLRGGRARPAASQRVRRLADAAQRRMVRRAVLGGMPLLIGLVVLDDLASTLRGAAWARESAAVDAIAISIDVALFIGLRRCRLAAAPTALVALLVTVSTSLVTIHLDPTALPASSAHLATIMAASGLFLPWTPRWHWAWLGSALALVAAASIVLPSAGASTGALLPALVIAALASGIGQSLLVVRLRRLTEQRFELRRLTTVTARQEHEVAELNAELVRTARIDTVTGIGNRRALDEAMLRLAGTRLAAVLLDLDHFKSFNDRNGHLAGDEALARVGGILRDTIRRDDLVFRYGGEEFLILIPGGDRESAARLAERVRAIVQHDPQVGPWGLTVSAGVAVADRFSASNPLGLLRRADAALYQAKRAGRNRVITDDPGSPTLSAAAGS